MPKLGEKEVNQCVDPRLNGEYPPKAVAEVMSMALIYKTSFSFNDLILVRHDTIETDKGSLHSQKDKVRNESSTHGLTVLSHSL